MLIVSNYHYIRTDFTTPYPSIFGVTPQQFKNQLLQLGKMGTFVHPKDLVENPEQYLNTKDTYILITFDDGLKEQFELAKPVLDKLGLGAFYFINTSNSSGKEVSLVHQIHLLRSVVSPEVLLNELKENSPVYLSPIEIQKARKHYNYDSPDAAKLKFLLNFKLSYADQEKFITPLFTTYFDVEEVLEMLYMNEKELTFLGKENQLGSHAHRHVPLGLLPHQTLGDELSISKNILETISGQSISAISYPYGNQEACTPEVAEAASTAGYRVGFTMTRKANKHPENRLLLHRFDCNDLPGGKNEIATALCALPY